MVEKFKIELEVEINDKEIDLENSSHNDYIESELNWCRESFSNFNINKIEKI